MTILFITRAYSPSAGGMERLSWELIHEIKKISGIEVLVIHPRQRKASPLLFSRIYSVLFLFSIFFRSIIAARRADVIHLGDPLLSKIGWCIRILYNKPVVVTVHGLDVAYQNPLYQLYVRLFFPRLSAYIAISKHVAALAKDAGAPADRIVVINPGIHDRFHVPTHIKTPSDRVVLLTVGRLVRRKGHEWFIRNVLPQLPDSYDYIIAGSGTEQSSITRAIIESGMQHRVQLLGNVSDDQLQHLYTSATAFVQPNILVPGDVEGFGLVLLEAALCNLPVYAAGIEGIKDAIVDGKNGHLLPSARTDFWVTALSNIRAIPGAREYTLKNFSWDIQAADYLSLFTKLSSA